MENASKALIIAAEVLIGVMVLTLGVYLYVSFSQTANEVVEKTAEQQLIQFNTQYTVYEDRDNLTIYDVINVINLAKENNIDIENNESDIRFIKVNITNANIAGSTVITDCQNDDKKELINQLLRKDIDSITEASPKLPTYTCKQIGYNTDGRVNLIHFIRN